MADVVQIDQRLDFPHDPQYFHNTPASIATTTPIIQPLSASFGGFDLTGEITAAAQSTRINYRFDWPLIAAMTFQLSDQDLPPHSSSVSSPQQQNSRQQFTEMSAFPHQNQHHHYPHDNSVQQLQPSPPFVEPSGNYIAVPPTTTTTTQSLSYGYPSSTLPTSHSITIDNGNVANNFSSHTAYVGNSNQQQQQHRVAANQLISSYGYHCLPQNYQPSIPSSVASNNSCQQPQKSISRSINSINSNYSQDVASNLFMPQFNNQTNNGSTMLLPLYDPSSTIFTTKPTTSISTSMSVSQNSPTSESASPSPTKQTYSYSGPPKSYYSRLPLYDRPFKCDQCPQSFNRNHDLKRHKRIHLAVKPYPCEYCEKQFSRKDALKRHILVKGCNNTSKKSTLPNNNNSNKSATKSTTNSSTKPIENYADSEDPIKTEPTSDNGYGMST